VGYAELARSLAMGPLALTVGAPPTTSGLARTSNGRGLGLRRVRACGGRGALAAVVADGLHLDSGLSALLYGADAAALLADQALL